jgi:hypothetical protein
MKLFTKISRSLKKFGRTFGKSVGRMVGGGQEIILSGGRTIKTSQCAPQILSAAEVNECSVSKTSKKCMRLKEARIKKSVHTGSCLTEDVLGKLIAAYNKHHTIDKISIPHNAKKSRQVKRTKRVDILWEAFAAKMDPKLTEHEWLEQGFVKSELSATEIKKIKEEHFRPEAPEEWKRNPRAWLSTDDIDKALIQYTKKYPDFKYFGAVPSDFSLRAKDGNCMISDLCAINLAQIIKEKYRFIGAVFNFDPHNKSGSHWVGMFVNIPKKEINYLDSNGYTPIPPIKQLLLTIKGQAAKLGKKFKIQYCKKRHQFKNTECGVYAINFISSQIEGKEFSEIANQIVKDEAMNERRKRFFNLD